MAGTVMSPKAPDNSSDGNGGATIKLLYFATAASFTRRDAELLSEPLPLRQLFDVLDTKYPGMHQKVLSSCAVTVNLEYVDMPQGEGEEGPVIQAGDEVAIIPPVSSG